MGYVWQNYGIYLKKYGIYLAKTMGYIGLRLKVILWDIFAKTMIYWTKSLGYIMGYIG